MKEVELPASKSNQLVRFRLDEQSYALSLFDVERIRCEIAARAVALRQGQSVNVTVSIGMAAFPEDAGSEQELIAAADRALYVAKQAGGNRVCTCQPGLETRSR